MKLTVSRPNDLYYPLTKIQYKEKNMLKLTVLLCTFTFMSSSQAATRVFYTGFENGTTSDLDYSKCTVVKTAPDGTGPKSGNYQLSCNWNGTTDWNDPQTLLDSQINSWPYTNEFFLRFWSRADADVDSNDGSKLFRLSSNSDNDEMYAACQYEYGPASAPLFMAWYIDGGPLGQSSVYYGGEERCGPNKWNKYEIYVKHDSDNTNGIVRVWVNSVMIFERVNVNTNTPGAKWYPFTFPSNWSSNPGWEHDANNHTLWDNIEIFSDSASGTSATGLMSDATISVSDRTAEPVTPPTGLRILQN